MLRFFRKFNLFKKRANDFISWSRIKLFLFVVGGIIIGLLVNPFFPKNLKFYWYQTFKIAIVNYQKIIGVGAEWYPVSTEVLARDGFWMFLVLAAGIVTFALSLKKQSRLSWTFLILTVMFFVLTLKSRRYVEYFIPFTVVFSALSIDIWLKANWHLLKKTFKSWKNHCSVLKVIAVLLFLSFFVLIGLNQLMKTHKDLSNGFKYSYLQKASEYIKYDSVAGEIVFHSDWDEFPILFYHNSKNYYIVGLDPTFMYEHNQERYWEYVDVTCGRSVTQIYETIKNKFGASYVLATTDHKEMIRNLSMNRYFSEVYKDDEALVFEVL